MSTKNYFIKKNTLCDAVGKEFIESYVSTDEYIRSTTFTIDSDRLRIDDRGGLIEDPPLLKLTEALSAKIAAALMDKVTQNTIVGVAGAYLILLEFDAGQMDAFGNDPAKMLGEVFREHKSLLESNALEPVPKSAATLGIRKKRLEMVEALAEVAQLSPSVTIKTEGGENIDVPSTSLDAIKALPKPPEQPHRVDGKITAIGTGDIGGVRMEIGSMMLHVDGVSIDEAFDYLKSGSHVRGLRMIVDGKKILHGAGFYTPDEWLL